MKIKLLYFASLAEAAGKAEETVMTEAADVRSLYAQLQTRYGFSLPGDALRLAVNGVFVDWDHPMDDGDEIVFIPPVSGG